MHNPRLAGRYAKSIIDLAVEKNQLDAVYADMKLILGICKSNPDFVAVLRSPIIKADKKGKIIASITTERVSGLTTAFITLLVNKGRETNLPEIADAYVSQYNKIKHIQRVTITTAVPISKEMQQSIVASVQAASGKNTIELEAIVDEDLIGGFVLETEGNLIDASILRDLKDVKKQFLNNDYIHKIR
jgi:F-type H+-transporting ATPase subunit delta